MAFYSKAQNSILCPGRIAGRPCSVGERGRAEVAGHVTGEATGTEVMNRLVFLGGREPTKVKKPEIKPLDGNR